MICVVVVSMLRSLVKSHLMMGVCASMLQTKHSGTACWYISGFGTLMYQQQQTRRRWYASPSHLLGIESPESINMYIRMYVGTWPPYYMPQSAGAARRVEAKSAEKVMNGFRQHVWRGCPGRAREREVGCLLAGYLWFPQGTATLWIWLIRINWAKWMTVHGP